MGINLGTLGVTKAYLGDTELKQIYLGTIPLLTPPEPELTYVGAITPLSVARRSPAATTVGNYALFGGGYASAYSTVVDAYDESLTRSTPTALSIARAYLAATTVGSCALFGGGNTGSVSAVVDAYTVI